MHFEHAGAPDRDMPIRFQRRAAASSGSWPAAQASPSDADVKSDRTVPAPAFSLTDARGTPVTLASIAEGVVLLNFWATWCGPRSRSLFIEFEQK
jgi:thiol-disulfide isomerase/thioredoxin